jgi:hypothetical protein
MHGFARVKPLLDALDRITGLDLQGNFGYIVAAESQKIAADALNTYWSDPHDHPTADATIIRLRTLCQEEAESLEMLGSSEQTIKHAVMVLRAASQGEVKP